MGNDSNFQISVLCDNIIDEATNIRINREEIMNIRNEIANIKQQMHSDSTNIDITQIKKLFDILYNAVATACSIPITIVITILSLLLAISITMASLISINKLKNELNKYKDTTVQQINYYEKIGDKSKIKYLKRVLNKIDDVLNKMK